MYNYCSDPHSVASLLVQQLLSHFSDNFLTSDSKSSSDQGVMADTGPVGKVARGTSLRDFLCDEVTLLLLSAIFLISQKVT